MSSADSSRREAWPVPECPVCAFDNPPSADVCGECGAPLTSAVPAPEPFTPGLAGGGGQIPERPVSSGRAAKADAGRVASGRDSRGATPPRKKGANLALEPSELTVDPGSAVTVTVTVHNLGDQVEQFVLSVNGPGGGFATADPADLHMLPDKKQTSVLRFTPVRDPRQPAGPQPFQVVARSTVNADVVARASGVVTVGGFAELTADLEPEVTRGLRPGTHRLELVNAGNEPTAVEVELHDESGELVFDPPAMDGRLEPGAREERSFRVVGPRAWFGRTAPFPFTLTVASTGAKQPLQLRAVRRQVPRFPWWIPTVALALVGIAVAVVALWPDSAKPPPNRVPNVALQEQAASEALLKERGYQPIAIPTSDTEVPSGKSIKTEPPVGTPVERGESVSLFVSRGPCPAEGCPPPAVPNVVGLPIADALRHMDDAGLIGQPVPPPGGDPAVGTVTDTRPGPGQPVGEDHRVALTIASVTSAAASSAASSASAAASSAAAASAPSSVS